MAEPRLTAKGIERAAPAIQFLFEGTPVSGLAGETIAASLTALGQLDLRQAGPNDRRGIFCGMGACQECLVEVDGRSSQRACMTRIAPGMYVRRHDQATSRLAALGASRNGQAKSESVDVAIVGAGPAGLAAAAILAQAGLHVVVVDERDQAGGQYFKPLAPSHRFTSKASDRQFAEGSRRRAAAQSAGAELRTGQLVWHATLTASGRPELSITGAGASSLLSADAVLLATGAYEIPYPVPGWTLPGVMSAGAAQTLARSYRVSPGRQVLVAGNGPLNWQLALELHRGGSEVVAVLESARPSGPGAIPALAGMALAAPRFTLEGLRLRAELAGAGIAVHQGTLVTAIEGEQRVQRVRARRFDGQDSTFEADAVSLGYGFLPSVEVLRLLGGAMRVDPSTGYPAPLVDASGRSSVDRVWVAGDGAGIGGSQVALARGEIAARDILARLGRQGRDGRTVRRRLRRAEMFQNQLWTLFRPSIVRPPPAGDTLVCRCEGVTAARIEAARSEGVGDLGSLKRHTRLGMGRCQGRYCSGMALLLLRGDLSTATEADLFAPQAPVRPVPATALATEKAEWGGHREVPTHVMARGTPMPDPLPGRCDLLVIGAGITGAATALFAAGHGMDVAVLDRDSPNSGASGGNAGSLHVQLLSWDFGKKAMAGGSPAQRTLPLQRDSVALWKSLEQDLGADFEIAITGGLMVAEDQAQAAFLRDKAACERAVGIETEVIGRAELSRLAPAVSDRMVIAAYCAAEGKINPLKATPAIVAEARRRGARFFAGHQIVAIAREGDDYCLSSAAGGVIHARRIVIAAGGWSRHLGRLLGCELPISGAPLQMLVTEPVRPLLKQLLAHADRHLTLKQAANGNLIIGGAWTAGSDVKTGYARVLRDSIEGNLWVAERTLPALSGLHLLRSWAAMNINIDGAPLLGPLPGHPAVFIAATANGYTLGPIMGRLTADLAAGRARAAGLDYFTLSRFG